MTGSRCSGQARGDTSSDPVITLWHQWQAAHGLTEKFRRQQQHLEQQLAKTVGFPLAMIELPGGERVAAYSREAIDDVFRLAPEQTAARAKARTRAEAEFATHRLRWENADREIGYSAMVQAEGDAGGRAANLIDAMAATSATSLAGVAAKLDAVLREGNIFEGGSEFPWPQICSVLDDLARMGTSPGLPCP